jgi:hypothetical protein
MVYNVTLEFRGQVEADSEEEALRIAHEEHNSTFECFNWAVEAHQKGGQ